MGSNVLDQDRRGVQKLKWNIKSTESLAQNHLALDVVGGWRQNPK
jgi:hypothetical protein